MISMLLKASNLEEVKDEDLVDKITNVDNREQLCILSLKCLIAITISDLCYVPVSSLGSLHL